MMLSNEMLTLLGLGGAILAAVFKFGRSMVTKQDLAELRKELEPLQSLPERVAALEAAKRRRR